MPADSALTRNSSCPALPSAPSAADPTAGTHCCCLDGHLLLHAACLHLLCCTMDPIRATSIMEIVSSPPGLKFLMTYFFFPLLLLLAIHRSRQVLRPIRVLGPSALFICCYQSKAKRCKSREMDRGCCPSLCLPPLSSCLFPSFFFSIFLDSKEKKQKGNSTTTARGPGCLHCIA